MEEVRTVIARPKSSTIITHAACGAEWSGLSTAHCGGCHRTFTGVWAFNKHRSYNQCRHPDDVGLVPAPRWYDCWGSPTEEHHFEKDVDD